MKKLLLLAPIAVLALASCSNDEQIAQSPALNAQELSFRPIVNGTTRTVITDANFNQFTVKATCTNGAFWEAAASGETTLDNHGTAATTIDNVVVAKGTNGKWDIIDGKSYYWSSKNAEASFIGYNWAEGTLYAVPVPVADQKDVLVAYNEGVASSFDNGVPMLFRHTLSQIVIKADNKDADIRQIKVAGVRLHNIGSKASLTHPTKKTTADEFDWSATTYTPWSAPNTPIKYTYYKGTTPTGGNVTEGNYITLNASAQEITFDGAALLLPQEIDAASSTDLSTATTTTDDANGHAYIDVLIQVQDLEELAKPASDDNKAAIFPKINVATTAIPNPNETIADQKFAWVAVPVEIAWKPGYKYTYVLHFSKDGIGKTSPDEEGGDPDPGTDPGTEIVDNPVPLYFTVTIDEWNDAANTEKDL